MSSEYAGLVFPEDILQREIDSGLKAIQQDEELFKRLVQRKNDAMRDELLNYLTQHEVMVRLGFAREAFEQPQITITLSGDSDERFLGDELFVRDRTLDATAKLGTAIVAGAVPPFTVQYNTLTGGPLPAQSRIRIGGEDFTYDSVSVATSTTGTLSIVGRGVGRSPKQAHALDDVINVQRLERELGVHSKVSYRLDILSDNANVVLWLQALVKAILLLKQDVFTEEGFSEFSMGGTDYAPRPSWYPATIYNRTIVYNFRIEVPFPADLAEVLKVELNPTEAV